MQCCYAQHNTYTHTQTHSMVLRCNAAKRLYHALRNRVCRLCSLQHKMVDPILKNWSVDKCRFLSWSHSFVFASGYLLACFILLSVVHERALPPANAVVRSSEIYIQKKNVWVNNNMPTKHYIRVYMRMQNSAVIVRRSLMARQTSKYDNQQSQDDGALDGM